MASLDIVQLIENNPITRLSNEYQNKFLSKLKNKFNTEDQQLFVTSFYSYLNYNPNNEFVIDFDKVWEWLDFSHKDKAKRLLENIFIIDKDYRLLTRTGEQRIGRGGHNKETIMLTINAFKRFCLKAGTKKADKIHNYYINLEELLHEIVNEESNELKQQLEKVKRSDQQKQITIDNLTKSKALEKHNILLREFGRAGALIYIIRVKSYENGEYIVKIGESREGVEARYNEHKTNYEEAVILDCFLVKRSKQFENYIHHHHDIKSNRTRDLQGHEKERELFLIGQNLSYAILTNTIKKNISRFNEIDNDEILNKIDKLHSLLLNNPQQQQFTENINTHQLVENQNILIEKIAKLENTIINLENTNKQILEKINSIQTRTTSGFNEPLATIGPKLQKINPETMQLVKVYETVAECMREDNRMKRPSIEKSVQESTIYNGFRWAYVDRQLDSTVIHNIQPTVQTQSQVTGYVAKLNANKSEILNVYLDRKTAAISNEYCSSGLDNAVQKGVCSKGHFYQLYDRCAEELKNNFVDKIGKEPLLYKEGVGRYDDQNNLIQEFACKYDCIKSLHMSDKTLAKALDKNVAYNSYFYRSIGSKLVV